MAKRLQKKTKPPDPGPINWKLLSQVLILVTAGLWIYWPILNGDWLWDDNLYITENPLLNEPLRLWKAWFVPGSFIEYYPIQETVQWCQWQLWGTNTLGYHLTNVFLHIFSSMLVWRLFNKFGLRLAWAGGLLFAIHPVMVESVAWIAELKNTLSLPPFLLAMCAWIDYEEHQRRRDYWLTVGWFLLAMLCKISMATFPVVILLYAWWKQGRVGWSDLKASAPFFAISLILGVATIVAGIGYSSLHELLPEVMLLGGFFSRLACAGLSLSFYFSKCLCPVGLMPIYPQWTVNPPSLLQFLPWPVIVAVMYWLWRRRQSWGRHALLGLGFFLITLAPFVGFIWISYMRFTWVMDHLLYIPIIGLIGLVAAGLGQFYQPHSAFIRPFGAGIMAIVMALLTFESHRYAKIFINQETLWTYTLTMQHNPEAYIAHNNLGKALAETGRTSEAIEHYEQALRLNPDYAEAHNNMGNALRKKGRIAEAIEQYKQALLSNPNFAPAHNDWGNALQEQGLNTAAIEQYMQALRLNPDFAEAHYNLGNTLLITGQITEAMEHYELALQIKPNYAEAHCNLGNAFAKMGRISEAITQFEIALKINPNFTVAQNNLEKLQVH